MASEQLLANDTPMGRLERMHCVLGSRVLELHEQTTHTYDIIQELDEGLQKAAMAMPAKWWLPPKIPNDDSMAFFAATGQLVNQLFHYNLLNQLHLPFMLRSSTEHRYDYSKITCVHASREVLSRFIEFRTIEGCLCRPVEYVTSCHIF